MKEVLALIELKKQEFSQLPLFKFMQNQSIEPKKRLAWAPCAVPFIMSFGELNEDGFRDTSSSDCIQLLINKHTEEDAHHWQWFLSDIEKLGFDCSLRFSASVKFLWSEETKIPRRVIHQLFRYALESEPIQKLVIIEVLESTGNVVFSHAAQVAQELEAVTGNKYLYFSSSHLSVETGHITGFKQVEKLIQNISLTEIQRQEAIDLLEKIYALVTDLVNSLSEYAANHYEQEPLGHLYDAVL